MKIIAIVRRVVVKFLNLWFALFGFSFIVLSLILLTVRVSLEQGINSRCTMTAANMSRPSLPPFKHDEQVSTG